LENDAKNVVDKAREFLPPSKLKKEKLISIPVDGSTPYAIVL
jgi:hypothetical protein